MGPWSDNDLWDNYRKDSTYKFTMSWIGTKASDSRAKELNMDPVSVLDFKDNDDNLEDLQSENEDLQDRNDDLRIHDDIRIQDLKLIAEAFKDEDVSELIAEALNFD